MTAVFHIKITSSELWDTKNFPYINCFKAIVSTGTLAPGSGCRIIVHITPQGRGKKLPSIYLGGRLHPQRATCQLLMGYNTWPLNKLYKITPWLAGRSDPQTHSERHKKCLTGKSGDHNVGAHTKSLTSSGRLISIAHFIQSWIIPLSIFYTQYIILLLCLQGNASLKKK